MKPARELLTEFFELKQQLQMLGVLRSERFTGDLGEWLVEAAYSGKRANSATQKGWDVEAVISGKSSKIQVKAHAKGKDNNARWSAVKNESLELFDYLVIIVMSDDYFIQDWFEIPSTSLKNILVQSGKSWVVPWEKVGNYRTDWKKLNGATNILNFESK